MTINTNISFCSLLLLMLILESCHKETELPDTDLEYILIFQQSDFNIPLERYFEITLNLESRRFSRLKVLESLCRLENPLSPLGEVSESVIQAIRMAGDVVALVDVSPDRKWVAVSCRTRYAEVNNGEAIFIDQGYLIDVGKVMIVKSFPIFSPCYFSLDSKHCFFSEGWNIKRMDLYSEEISSIGVATSFLILPERDKLIMFDKGEVWLSSSNGSKIVALGWYKDRVYSSGIIDENWGYFLTSHSSKGGTKKLFFINFATQNILRYPYKLPEARLLRVIK